MTRVKHIVYVVSSVQKSLAFEWVAVRLRKSYHLTFVLLNDGNTALEDFLRQHRVDVVRITFRGKKDYFRAFFTLYRFLRREQPTAVHAHLLDAQVLGLSAALCAGVKKRIYTRHNSNFHQVYHRKGVLYDRISNRLATHVVSVSQATDRTLLSIENVDARKIRRISHGSDLSYFQSAKEENTQLLREKWSIPETYPCIGVIARQIKWKGIQFVIPAFKRLLKDYPGAFLILANASGPDKAAIDEQLAGIPSNSYGLIPFENDVISLYSLFDVYVHVPIDDICEAFGQTYVEALAAGVPSVFTRSGIAAEFIEHGKNAWIVDYKNSDEIYEGIRSLLENERLRLEIAQNGLRSVQQFEIGAMITKLQQVYDE